MVPKSPVRWAEKLLAATVLLLAALLIWNCLDIYRSGNAPDNLTAEDVYRQDVYRPEDVRARLSNLAWAGWLLLAALVCAAAERRRHPLRKSIPAKEAHSLARCDETDAPDRKKRWLQAAIFAAAVGLLVAGVFNGGMRDVLIKAINLCSECIGLG